MSTPGIVATNEGHRNRGGHMAKPDMTCAGSRGQPCSALVGNEPAGRRCRHRPSTRWGQQLSRGQILPIGISTSWKLTTPNTGAHVPPIPVKPAGDVVIPIGDDAVTAVQCRTERLISCQRKQHEQPNSLRATGVLGRAGPYETSNPPGGRRPAMRDDRYGNR